MTTTSTTTPKVKKVKKSAPVDQWGEPASLFSNHEWTAVWLDEHQDVLVDFELIFGLITTPNGGIEHRPGPRFISVESLRNRRIFVMSRTAKKPSYKEVDKEQSDIDYEAGVVTRPYVLLGEQLGAFPDKRLARLAAKAAAAAKGAVGGPEVTPALPDNPAPAADSDEARYEDWLRSRAGLNGHNDPDLEVNELTPALPDDGAALPDDVAAALAAPAAGTSSSDHDEAASAVAAADPVPAVDGDEGAVGALPGAGTDPAPVATEPVPTGRYRKDVKGGKNVYTPLGDGEDAAEVYGKLTRGKRVSYVPLS